MIMTRIIDKTLNNKYIPIFWPKSVSNYFYGSIFTSIYVIRVTRFISEPASDINF